MNVEEQVKDTTGIKMSKKDLKVEGKKNWNLRNPLGESPSSSRPSLGKNQLRYRT